MILAPRRGIARCIALNRLVESGTQKLRQLRGISRESVPLTAIACEIHMRIIVERLSHTTAITSIGSAHSKRALRCGGGSTRVSRARSWSGMSLQVARLQQPALRSRSPTVFDRSSRISRMSVRISDRSKPAFFDHFKTRTRKPRNTRMGLFNLRLRPPPQTVVLDPEPYAKGGTKNSGSASSAT